MKRYSLKKKPYIRIISLVDSIGRFFFRRKKKFSPKSFSRILVMRCDHLGDVLLTTPLFSSIKKQYPEVHLSVCVQTAYVSLLDNNPFIDSIIEFNAPWFLRNKESLLGACSKVVFFVRQLRKSSYDLVILPRTDARHIFITWCAGITNRIGFGNTGLGFLLTHELLYSFSCASVKRLESLVASLPLHFENVRPELFLDDKEKLEMKLRLEKYGYTEETLLFCIHPFAGVQSKIWPIESFRILIKKVTQKFENSLICIVGSDPSADMIKELCEENSQRIIDFTNKLSLRSLVSCIALSSLCITNDSGPAHIAEAVATPQVVLCSGTNIASQWYYKYQYTLLISKDVRCAPCEKTTCLTHECMKMITQEDVMESIKKQLNLIPQVNREGGSSI